VIIRALELSISITDQINQKYREYALYVLQSRGIPNFYDSLTPVQRIILQNSPSQFNKTIGLVGEVIRTGLYHHGDSSLAGAISKRPGIGMMINSSRAILYASSGDDYASAARVVAQETRDALRTAQEKLK
jgi:orotidine-5'-phosphate decarboxylase